MVYAVKRALIDRMKADAELRALTAPHVSGSGNAGVYGTIPVPVDARLPYIVVPAAISDVPDDTFDVQYREVLLDVHAYDDRPDTGGGSEATVDAITERIRALFHRQPFTAAGSLRPLIVEVAGIRPNDDDEGFGRILTLRIRLGVQ